MGLYIDQEKQSHRSGIKLEAVIPPELHSVAAEVQRAIAEFEDYINMAATADPEKLGVDPFVSYHLHMQGITYALEKLTTLRQRSASTEQASASMRRGN